MTHEEKCFLEWFNDFLTYERYAEYYGLTLEEAARIINKGRDDHYERTGK